MAASLSGLAKRTGMKKLSSVKYSPAALISLIGPDSASGGTNTSSCVGAGTVNLAAFPPENSTPVVWLRLRPETFTFVPVTPWFGSKPVTYGPLPMMVSGVKVVSPPNAFCTVSFPVAAFNGRSTRICVAAVTANRTAMFPSSTRVAPLKFDPRNVTHLPRSASIGSNDSITGARVTVNATSLKPWPCALVTFTRPVTAFSGTVKSSCFGDGVLCPPACTLPT